MLEGQNICVLDLETKASAEDCRYCGKQVVEHAMGDAHPCYRNSTEGSATHFERLGWDDKAALGLSIGCYFDYTDGHLAWFDTANLGKILQTFLDTEPLLVSFNGIHHDFPLMCAVMRHHDYSAVIANGIDQACQDFEDLYATSYDILAEIWKIDPGRKFARGLNSLDAICKANLLPCKEMDGATAPRLWQQGHYAEVIQYNVGDVLRTKRLFEMICEGMPLLRGDGQPILLPKPLLP